MMRDTDPPGERPLYWVASSKKDLLAMPQPVVRAIGVALGVADVVLIRARLKAARRDYEERYGQNSK